MPFPCEVTRTKNVRLEPREVSMTQPMYPVTSNDLARKRRDLAPEMQAVFEAFSQRVFADGALSAKTKQLIAVAVAHVTQ